jgi:hypothetical protein
MGANQGNGHKDNQDDPNDDFGRTTPNHLHQRPRQKPERAHQQEPLENHTKPCHDNGHDDNNNDDHDDDFGRTTPNHVTTTAKTTRATLTTTARTTTTTATTTLGEPHQTMLQQ